MDNAEGVAIISGWQLLLLFLLCGLPAVTLWLAKQHKALQAIGPVLLCYSAGLLLAQIPDLDSASSEMSKTVMEVSIPLAIPLLLFGLSIRLWLRQSKAILGSFGLAVISVFVVATAGYYCFADLSAEADKAAGMLASMYTGGSISMAAVSLSLQASDNLFTALQGSDILLGGAYLLFLLSVARPFYGLLLKPFPGVKTVDQQAPIQTTQVTKLLRRRVLLLTGFAGALSVVIMLVAAAISLWAYGQLDVELIMFIITLLALLASCVRWIREIPSTFSAGYYLMLVFCVALGSRLDISQILQHLDPLFGMVAFIMLGSIALHLLLAKLFGIDRDTFIITSTATIYGPPFIPSVATAIRNPAMVLPGLVTGLMGYVIAHNLGALLARALSTL